MGSQVSSTRDAPDPATINTSSNEPIDPPHTPHTPSPNDVHEVKRLMLDRLPLELIDIILHEAQYWPKITTKDTKKDEVSNGSVVYSISPVAIPTHATIRSVEFRIRSCDQGWGGDPGLVGPYDGSWTWFEAEIFRDAAGDGGSGAAGEEWLGIDGRRRRRVRNVADGGSSWSLQRNHRASGRVREHVVVWTEEEVGGEGGEDREKGCGLGRGFVRSLAAGDEIAVVAWARYPGWVNKVYEVEVGVFFSV